MIDIKILNTPINTTACISTIENPDCGGINIFIGTVRNQTKGNKVIRLEYEAYQSMALKEMENIAKEAIEKWDIKNILIHHRIGNLAIKDIAVIIVVNAPH